MIDFSKYSSDDLVHLNSIVIKNLEKSEASKLYFFTQNVIEKAKVFVYAYRILRSACKFISSEHQIKAEIELILLDLEPRYSEIIRLLESHSQMIFGRSDAQDRIFRAVYCDSKVEELIDTFSFLCERTEMIQIAKVKGHIIEGNSGKAFKKMFVDSPKDFHEPVLDL